MLPLVGKGARAGAQARTNARAGFSGSVVRRGAWTLEFIVHASKGTLHIRFGINIDDTSATTAGKRRALRAEAHEVVFGKHRPLRHEHPFDTGTDCPASTVV